MDLYGICSHKGCYVAVFSPVKYKMYISQSIMLSRGTWVTQSVKHLPSAQVTIPGSWDRDPHQAP